MIPDNSNRKLRVAIVGGGPSGNTLAILLAEKGVDVVVFDKDKRPDLVVGESLVPQIVTLFQRLGIEEEVAKIGQHKPGVTIRYENRPDIFLDFKWIDGIAPPYSYNIPRPAFEDILDKRAEEAGIRKIKTRATLVAGTDPSREVELSADTLTMIPEWDSHPDLVVDATGRNRTICRLLDIPAKVGPRKDVAYFAHYTDFDTVEPKGQLLITLLQRSGWAWRIQLRDRLSVGVVINKDIAAEYGNTPEERLEAIIDSDPQLGPAGKNRKRLTDVPVYTNYQLISQRGFGPGWIATGDAYGFVDPMLSSGLFLSLWSSAQLADLISPDQEDPFQSFAEYEKEMFHMIDCWQDLVEKFYDGTLFAAYMAGKKNTMKFEKWPITPVIDRYLTRSISGMLAGVTTTNPFYRKLLWFLTKYGKGEFDPKELAIK